MSDTYPWKKNGERKHIRSQLDSLHLCSWEDVSPLLVPFWPFPEFYLPRPSGQSNDGDKMS